MPILFKKTKQLEAQVEEFWEAISEGAIVFKHAIKDYLDGEKDKFEDRIITISKLESKADNLRRTIENQLYSQSLIPEHRGDVLGLLESLDHFVNTAKTTYVISSPVIEYLQSNNIATTELEQFNAQEFENPSRIQAVLKSRTVFDKQEIRFIIDASQKENYYIDPLSISSKIDTEWLSREQVNTLKTLSGQSFHHKWQLVNALTKASDVWQLRANKKLNKAYNKDIKSKRQYLFDSFRLSQNDNDN